MFLINEYPRNVWSRNIGPHRETFYLPIKPIKKLLFITLSLRFLSDEGTLSTPRLPSYTPQWILNELHRSTIIFLFIIISSINRATFHNFTKIDTRSFFFFFFFFHFFPLSIPSGHAGSSMLLSYLGTERERERERERGRRANWNSDNGRIDERLLLLRAENAVFVDIVTRNLIFMPR